MDTKIRALFHACQQSFVAHPKAKSQMALLAKENMKEFQLTFFECLDRVLTCWKR